MKHRTDVIQPPVMAFLDTEFTGLGSAPVLLSVGIVLGGGNHREFYAEVVDADRLGAAASFTVRNVLPQFGYIAGAGCLYVELVVRLRAFLLDLAPLRESGKFVEIAFNSDIDWMLIQQALKDDHDLSLPRIAHFIRPVNIYNMLGFAAGEAAADDYYASQATSPVHRHHALCDARALRIAYAAASATGAPRRSSRS